MSYDDTCVDKKYDESYEFARVGRCYSIVYEQHFINIITDQFVRASSDWLDYMEIVL